MLSTSAQQPAGLSDADRRIATPLAPVGLDDKYTSTSGLIYLSGIQALVRLPLMQRRRELIADYRAAMLSLIATLDADSPAAVAIVGLAEKSAVSAM